jgi:peroxiredoxin
MFLKYFSFRNVFLPVIFLVFPSFIFSQNTPSNVHAGTVLNVKLIPSSNPAKKKIDNAYLGYYKGNDFKLVDSAKVKPDRPFILKALPGIYGIYEIALNKESGMPLVITAADKQLDISLKFKDSVFIERPEFNRENKAFTEISELIKSFNKSINELKTFLSGLNETAWREKMDSVRVRQDTLMQQFNRSLYLFRQKNTGTYASEFIASLFYFQNIGMRDIRFVSIEQRKYMQEHFFDKIPMLDEQIIYNPFFYDVLVKYFSDYSGREPDGFKKCADVLMEKASGNPIVKEYALKFLLDIFIENGPEEVLFYITDNYLEECTDNIPEVTVKRIKQMRDFKTGAYAPEINLPDTSGKMIGLNSLDQKQPIILYFWSSTCAHCQQETPKYIQLYKEFKDKGLKVYAVSLDEKKEDWTGAIRNWGLDWINVCDFQKYNSPAAKSYYVYATPAVFLLDEQKKIVLVNPKFDEIRGFLENFYKQ